MCIVRFNCLNHTSKHYLDVCMLLPQAKVIHGKKKMLIWSKLVENNLFCLYTFCIFVTWWGSEHTTPHTLPWHIKYLKLKEFENTAEAGRSTTYLNFSYKY